MADGENAKLYHVAVQKVFLTMKAIVDGKKDVEFLEKCLELGADRYVLVSPEIVKLVKEFLADHELSQNMPSDMHLRTAQSAAIRKSVSNGETCF